MVTLGHNGFTSMWSTSHELGLHTKLLSLTNANFSLELSRWRVIIGVRKTANNITLRIQFQVLSNSMRNLCHKKVRLKMRTALLPNTLELKRKR